MQPFQVLQGLAAPFQRVNIDTDLIIPKQFLKTIQRTGLGKHLFEEVRYFDNGQENPSFVLNQPDFRPATILIAGDNFGCGSSREHAPWALLDYGIRCIIAPSFADIFYNNCFKNGILPIVLPEASVQSLMKDADTHRGQTFTVDLPGQMVISASGGTYTFDIEGGRKTCLLEGLDDIALTLKKNDAIAAFEQRDQIKRPWVHFLGKVA
jgi:3-isopropylmalate/(R)-2-methylmalate dehydratase small subunit